MVIFSYKNYFNGILRAIVALAVGVVMIVSRTDATVLAVQIIAAGLLVSGIITLVRGLRGKRSGGIQIMDVSGGFNILVSILMFIYPEPIAHIIVFFIGLALFGFGLLQFFGIYSLSQMTPVSMFSFIMPVLVILLGGLLMFSPDFLGRAVGTVAGIALILYAVSEFTASWKAKNTSPGNNYMDVDNRDIDEQ